jgi:predicted naringenin-chalcone synthase
MLSAADRESLRVEQKRPGAPQYPRAGVPELAARHAEAVLTEVLERTEVPRGQVTGWIMHAGGRNILLAMQKQLGLTARARRYS